MKNRSWNIPGPVFPTGSHEKILVIDDVPAQLAKAGKLGNGPCLFKPYTLENMATLVLNRLKSKGSDEKNALPHSK